MACAVLRGSLVLIIVIIYTEAQKSDGIIFPGPTERPSKFPLSTTTSTPVNSIVYIQCFNSCLATSEYNPVCGTDNVVYSNPGRLRCAQNCGKQVELSRFGQCGNNTSS